MFSNTFVVNEALVEAISLKLKVSLTAFAYVVDTVEESFKLIDSEIAEAMVDAELDASALLIDSLIDFA